MTATIDHALASASEYVHVEVSRVETSKELATGKTVELDTGRDPLPMINFDNKREGKVKLWKLPAVGSTTWSVIVVAPKSRGLILPFS